MFNLKDNLDKITNQELIHTLWSLIVSDDELIKSPLTAKVFEKLYDFKRDNALTKEELIELH
jgi:hypothetical protein